MNKKLNSILDFYVSYAFVLDCLIITIVIFLSLKNPLLLVIIPGRNELIQLAGLLLNTQVTFTGFLLAAITIFITIRASAKSKKVNEENGKQVINALDTLFLSKIYFKIMNVFKVATIELLLSILIVIIFQFVSYSRSNLYELYLVLVAISISTILPFSRCLLILFKSLFLEKSEGITN